jgi:hypothetical protein
MGEDYHSAYLRFHTRRRVPAVYLAHAIHAIVAIPALVGMNNLRASSSADGSFPTALPTFFLLNYLPPFLYQNAFL